MKTKWTLAAVAMGIAFGSGPQSSAQALVSRSFDMVFAGDDPTEGFGFLLPGDPAGPVRVSFDGYFENLDPFETGVRSGLSWLQPDGTWDGSMLTDLYTGLRLPGADPVLGTPRVPLEFEQQLTFTPAETHFWVEGLGPADQFRFVGEFAIEPVPEPNPLTLLGAAGMVTILCRLGLRRKVHAT